MHLQPYLSKSKEIYFSVLFLASLLIRHTEEKGTVYTNEERKTENEKLHVVALIRISKSCCCTLYFEFQKVSSGFFSRKWGNYLIKDVSWIRRVPFRFARKWKPRYLKPRYAGTGCRWEFFLKINKRIGLNKRIGGIFW